MRRARIKRRPDSPDIHPGSASDVVARGGTVAVHLQQAAGNQAVQHLLRPPPIGGAHHEGSIDPAAESRLQTGRSLDPALQAEMSRHIGGDFSSVRIHDDPSSAASADRHNALAYTVANHIIFAAGQFAPHTHEGRRLLAHELTHTQQQARDNRPRIQRQNKPGTVDVDVEPTDPAEQQRLKAAGVNLPTVGQSTWQTMGGSPYSVLIPAYQQDGQTCGAASLVSALLIWDREHWDPAHPNSRAVEACDLILEKLERYGPIAARRWADTHPIALCHGDAGCNREAWLRQRDTFTATITAIRNSARTPGATVPEHDYQQLGMALYYLWNQGHAAGLGSSEVFQIQKTLGLNTGIVSGLSDFDSIFTNPIIVALAADEMAQVFWFVEPTLQQHGFIIGRLATGKWFLSDQGVGKTFETDTLPSLHSTVRLAASTGYWIYTGSKEKILNPGFVGVQKLASSGGTHDAVRQTIPAGSVLGQVDAGYMTIGDDITVGTLAGREYSLAAAQALLPAGPGGGVVVEMPSGVFTVYGTSAVSEANLDQTSFDVSDSANMLLGGARQYHHAWLILGNRFGVRRSWFQVY